MLIKSLLQWTSGLKSKEVKEETRCFSGSDWIRIWSQKKNPKEWLKLTSLEEEDTFSAIKKTGNGVGVKGCNSIWNRAKKRMYMSRNVTYSSGDEWMNGWWCCFATTRHREKRGSAEPVKIFVGVSFSVKHSWPGSWLPLEEDKRLYGDWMETNMHTLHLLKKTSQWSNKKLRLSGNNSNITWSDKVSFNQKRCIGENVLFVGLNHLIRSKEETVFPSWRWPGFTSPGIFMTERDKGFDVIPSTKHRQLICRLNGLREKS